MTRQMPAGMGQTVSIGSHRWSASQMTVAVESTARTNGKLTISVLFVSLLNSLHHRIQVSEEGIWCH